MRLATLLAPLALGLLLQGCGDCPASKPHELSRQAAVVQMICQEAVLEELARIETKVLQHLKSSCMEQIQNFDNLPKGKFTVEAHCEGWGAQHMLAAHRTSEDFLLDNCTKWAKEKLESEASNSTEASEHSQAKQLFDDASVCLEKYAQENTEDLDLSASYYDAAVAEAKNETDGLIVSLKKAGNRVMNEELHHMDDENENKFELAPRAPLRQARPAGAGGGEGAPYAVVAFLGCASVCLLLLRAHFTRTLEQWRFRECVPEGALE